MGKTLQAATKVPSRVVDSDQLVDLKQHMTETYYLSSLPLLYEQLRPNETMPGITQSYLNECHAIHFWKKKLSAAEAIEFIYRMNLDEWKLDDLLREQQIESIELLVELLGDDLSEDLREDVLFAVREDSTFLPEKASEIQIKLANVRAYLQMLVLNESEDMTKKEYDPDKENHENTNDIIKEYLVHTPIRGRNMGLWVGIALLPPFAQAALEERRDHLKWVEKQLYEMASLKRVAAGLDFYKGLDASYNVALLAGVQDLASKINPLWARQHQQVIKCMLTDSSDLEYASNTTDSEVSDHG